MTMVAFMRYATLGHKTLPFEVIDRLEPCYQTDDNLTCLVLCAKARYFQIFPHKLAGERDAFLKESEKLFQMRGSGLRPRVLVTLFDALVDRMDPNKNDPNLRAFVISDETAEATKALLDPGRQPPRAWSKPFSGRTLSYLGRSGAAVLALKSHWRSIKDVSPDQSDAINTLVALFERGTGKDWDDNRCISVSGLILRLKPLFLNGDISSSFRQIGACLVQALSSNPTPPALLRSEQVWTVSCAALASLVESGLEIPHMDDPALARGCAQRLLEPLGQQEATNLLKIMASQSLFWRELEECARDERCTKRQLRNIAFAIVEGRSNWGNEALQLAIGSDLLSTIGRRLASLYGEPRGFDHEDFLLLFFASLLAATLCLEGDRKANIARSKIASSLMQSWAALISEKGEDWLKKTIDFWQAEGLFDVIGERGKSDLDWLESICQRERERRLRLNHPDAGKLLLASYIYLPHAEETLGVDSRS
ncbi:hypothetical protein BOTBODRAFT_443055 [Botryobasidium botryosum FD-172 SS1]|uniref:Uncharacterized protein n=1 Tax=Botryobasidium botryosum (strain FD-172 SS1) TaxID=930990 RepID=A0A067MUY7_BOTB1|nr:hypothetical protein BOTBODRAFT_443055 [Botryobasidium botryosum FD-172 SS1]